ncbi:MAG: DUF2306 domain-containing protein [Bacteroidetes bacterium]|nr:MAG: DUF2306 domain-containing protein [Bacteroidota bacterium]
MIHHPTGLFHTLAAVVALIAGTFVLLRRKGDLIHKRAGYVYTLAMALLNVSAFMIYDLWGRLGPFHFAALVSAATLYMGIRAALRRREGWYEQHYYWMSWSVVGLYAAFVAEVGVRMVPWGAFWLAVFGALFAVMAGGSWLIRKNAPHSPTINPSSSSLTSNPSR